MKKLLALILSFVLLLSLCACGGGTTSQETTQTPEVSADTNSVTESNTEETIENEAPTLEELLDTAVELDGHTFFEEYQSNKVKLSSQYEGISYLVAGIIDSIESDHIVVTDSNLKVNVYIPTEEIIELEKDQYVEVVGILENIGYEQNMSLVWVTVDFNTGYVSKSTYTKTGEYNSYHSTDGTHPQGLCLKCVNDSGKTYFVELELTAEQRDTLTNGQEITVEGRLFVNDNDMPHSAYTKLIVDTIEQI